MLARLVDYLFIKLIKIFSRITTLLTDIHLKKSTPSNLKRITSSTINYNMLTEPDEAYYSTFYLNVIQTHIPNKAFQQASCITDLGCGQGRFLKKLVMLCGEKTDIHAIDISPTALEEAKQAAGEKIFYHQSKIQDWLISRSDNSIDIALFLEVAFYMPNILDIIKLIHKKLKPKGFLAISTRSLYFNILHSINIKKFHHLPSILANRQGRIWDSDIIYSWNTSAEIKKELSNLFEIKSMTAVGACSGIKGDPLAHLIRPSELTTSNQSILLETELAIGKDLPDCGRYTLTICQKHD